jgi:hypothetical protein
MKHLLIAVLATAALTPTAGAVRNPGEVKIVRDVPLATTFYFPARVPQARDRLTLWRVYPYVGQKANGETYFRLRLSLSTGMWANSWAFREVTVVADGTELPLNLAEARQRIDPWTRSETNYDFAGPEVEGIVRKLASAEQAWVIVYASGDSFRNNIRLNPEHLEAFRVILDEFERLSSPGPEATH